MSDDAPLILVSNDDGITARGLEALSEALRALGRVVVVAPESEQSATSHSITLARPLRMRPDGVDRWAVDGTPVDCVYVALHHREVLPRRPDVVVSGINHGLNMGGDVFYSGTVAAAREGALRGIPGLAVSLARDGDRVFTAELAVRITKSLLEKKGEFAAGPTPLLNLNVPEGAVKGVESTTLGPRLYDDLVEVRNDPRGRQYLWIGGPNVRHPPSEGTDTSAYERGYASLTPLSSDLNGRAHRTLCDALVHDGARSG